MTQNGGSNSSWSVNFSFIALIFSCPSGCWDSLSLLPTYTYVQERLSWLQQSIRPHPKIKQFFSLVAPAQRSAAKLLTWLLDQDGVASQSQPLIHVPQSLTHCIVRCTLSRLAMDAPPCFVVTAWRNSRELLQLRQDIYSPETARRTRAVNKVS